MFADPQVEPTESGLDGDFFDEQYYALDWRFPTFFFGMPGSQNITYNYNTKEFLRLDNLTQQFVTQTRSSDGGSGVIAYNFHQYVYVEPGQDTASIGYDADKERLQGLGASAGSDTPMRTSILWNGPSPWGWADAGSFLDATTIPSASGFTTAWSRTTSATSAAA